MLRFLLTFGIAFSFININLSSILPLMTTRRIGFIMLILAQFLIPLNSRINKKLFNFLLILLLYYIPVILSSLMNFSWNFFIRELLLNTIILFLTIRAISSFSSNITIVDIRNFILIVAVLNVSYITQLISSYPSENIIFALRKLNTETSNFSLNTYFNGLILTLPLFPIYLKSYDTKNFKIIVVLLLFAQLTTIILSTSRQATLSTLLILLPLYFPNTLKKLIAFILIVFSYLLFNSEIILGLFSRFSGANSDNYRLEKYFEALDLFYQNPFGIGYGQYLSRFKAPLESSYLQILVELGIFGLLWLALFLLFILFTLSKYKEVKIVLPIVLSILFLMSVNEILFTTHCLLTLLFIVNFNEFKLNKENRVIANK